MGQDDAMLLGGADFHRYIALLFRHKAMKDDEMMCFCQ